MEIINKRDKFKDRTFYLKDKPNRDISKKLIKQSRKIKREPR